MTQNQRILAVLADGRWHTTSNLYKQAGGYLILHSRISELRSRGHEIEGEHVPGKTGARGYRYRWTNPPENQVLVSPDVEEEAHEVPRDMDHRYRIYCVPRYGEQTLIATAPDAESVGVALVTMGLEGQLKGCVVGLLDTHGTDAAPGTWVWNPHEGRW